MNLPSHVNVGVPIGEVISAFHALYYYSLQWDHNRYLGYQIKQCPMDLHLYQEIVFRTKPGFILQTGVAGGGSILFFANLLDLCGAPPEHLVIGIDIHLTPESKTIQHPRVRLIEGSSINPEVRAQATSLLPASQAGMVILDSDHTAAHVHQELLLYHELVGIGQYLVVEDTNINGHPVLPAFGAGPLEGADAFLKQHPQFISDDIWKRNLFSFHQFGWLQRIH